MQALQVGVRKVDQEMGRYEGPDAENLEGGGATMMGLQEMRSLRSGLWVLMAAALCVCAGCGRCPQMADLPPEFSILRPLEVPVILVGQAVENCQAAGSPHASRWTHRVVQLWKVRVRVERVLQGDLPVNYVEVYYFVDFMGGGGSQRLLTNIVKGHSEIFFLEPDGHDWRSVCDTWRSCVVWVRTGTHSKYRVNPELPLATLMVDLLLSRGDHTTDEEMMDAIYHAHTEWGYEPVIEKLQRLVKEESPRVQAAAAKKLRELPQVYRLPELGLN